MAFRGMGAGQTKGWRQRGTGCLLGVITTFKDGTVGMYTQL